MTYATGHVKRNTETGEVAVRTIFPISENTQQAMMEWLCAAPNTGPRNTWTIEVESWEDLFVPEPTPPVDPFPVDPPPGM